MDLLYLFPALHTPLWSSCGGDLSLRTHPQWQGLSLEPGGRWNFSLKHPPLSGWSLTSHPTVR